MLTEHCISSFRAMSYNIRLDLVQDGQNQWNLRKDRLTSLIRYHKPDLFGVQEALPHQVVNLKMALPAFDWYGVGRDDGKNRGEFSAVFYRSDRFEILDNGSFWLSETPDIAGIANVKSVVSKLIQLILAPMKSALCKLALTKRAIIILASVNITFEHLLFV
ncbi:unnamed protein product [Rotaria sp. Silwood2]|nr:unnamed protein product [Rotaria sp. Silwood2]CAF3969128.1 unnamed protein product [Rotaria sp. Silwood2]CAF4005022.1 unnamed protein product [Rotaria sp. Silwood2]